MASPSIGVRHTLAGPPWRRDSPCPSKPEPDPMASMNTSEGASSHPLSAARRPMQRSRWAAHLRGSSPGSKERSSSSPSAKESKFLNH